MGRRPAPLLTGIGVQLIRHFEHREFERSPDLQAEALQLDAANEICVGRLTRAEFERVVGEALDSLPKRFAELVENVLVTVEEEPSPEELESTEENGDGDSELLGVYRGVALTARTHDEPLLPDEIVIFRGPINRVTRTWDEAVDEVRETVIHELGHYFGLDDDEMPD